MRISKIWTQNVRQVLFAMIPFIWLGGQSLHYFLLNDANSFEKMGALIILWALINISINRTKYGSNIADLENSLLSEHIKYYREMGKIKDESFELSFDLHTLQISRIYERLGFHDSHIENRKNMLSAMSDDIERRLNEQRKSHLNHNMIHSNLEEFKSNYRKEIVSLKSWERFLWRFELTMAIWGTLQGAYGADLVQIFHST